jgi:hypothetical protein
MLYIWHADDVNIEANNTNKTTNKQKTIAVRYFVFENVPDENSQTYNYRW